MAVDRPWGLRRRALVAMACIALGWRPAAADAGSDGAARAAGRLAPLLPCAWPGVEERLLCGTLEVAEDRRAAGGRRLGLRVVVVPARVDPPPEDPIVILAGGPGGAATSRAAGLARATPLRGRDILLVDQRGAGGSNPLDCELPPAPPPGRVAVLYPEAAVARCAAALAARADPRLYDTASFVDDIEEVRVRLGYGRLNIQGGSYGSRAMVVFAQRHPGAVRTLFGIGLDSPVTSNLATRGETAEAALAALTSRCAAVPDCAALTPDLERSMRWLLGRLERSPRAVAIPSADGPPVRLDLGRDWLAEQVRTLLYFAHTARALPWAVHRAEQAADWVPLGRLARASERWFQVELAEGLSLTVQCGENLRFDRRAALLRNRRTLFGAYRLERQIAACRVWPHVAAPLAGVERPRPLSIPALLLSGALDPVTPPRFAEEARRLLADSRHVVIAEGHHDPFALRGARECIHRVWADFVGAGSLAGLDTACLERLAAPPFAIDAAGFEAHYAASFDE